MDVPFSSSHEKVSKNRPKPTVNPQSKAKGGMGYSYIIAQKTLLHN